jgi:DNA-binding response OmpR family regulator
MKPQVLVVDDSLTIRMDLRAALGAAGFLVTACETRALAMKVLESRPFSLVILDVLLPDGDGIDLLRQIRNSPQCSRVPVIFLLTEAEVKDRILGLTFGADEYIGKPYDVGYLVQRARDFMSRYGSIPAPAPDSGRPGKILAVDDSPTYLDALARVLHEDGHDIILARSGEEALDLLMCQSVECVIMDLLMPGMGGMEAARRIRNDAAMKSIPIMILTGRDEPRDRHIGAQIGVDEFVIKSPELSMLKVQLRGLLRRVRRAKRTRDQEDSVPPPSSTSFISNQVIAGSLLDKVIAASGLSMVIGPSTIGRACMRAGVDAKLMSELDLRRALPEIEETLRIFFSGEERRHRLAAITALAHGIDGNVCPSATS